MVGRNRWKHTQVVAGCMWLSAAAVGCAADLTPVTEPTTPPAPTVKISSADYAQQIADQIDLDNRTWPKPSDQVTVGDWQQHIFYPEDGPICFDGSRYRAAVRPGDPKKVMVYLQGGGACWDHQTCFEFPLAFLQHDVPEEHGIFDRANPNNPLADWSTVFGSYCDGSFWVGDRDAVYDGRRTYHRGLQNLMATVELARTNFPDMQELVVAGSSAGGYGTFPAYLLLRALYPDLPIRVMSDGGFWLENRDGRYMYDNIRTEWDFLGHFPPTDCTQCDEQITYMVDWALQRDRNLRWGVFSWYHDLVIGGVFFGYGLDFDATLVPIIERLRQQHPQRFGAFMADGFLGGVNQPVNHTAIQDDLFYELTYGDTGTMRDWFAGLFGFE